MNLFSEVRSLKFRKPTIEGINWCSPAKTQAMMDLILQYRPMSVVEVGVFGGASLLQMAIALKHIGMGKIIGVDPWSKEAALEGVTCPINIKYWEKMNFAALKRGCERHIAAMGLSEFCELRQMRSEEAAQEFADGSVDLWHMDGNHSEIAAMRDAQAWLSKIADGGIIIVDDVGWVENNKETVWPAVEWLLESCNIINDQIENVLVLRKES